MAGKKPIRKSARKKPTGSNRPNPRKKSPRRKTIRRRTAAVAKLPALGVLVVAAARKEALINDVEEDVLPLETDDDFPPDIGGSE